GLSKYTDKDFFTSHTVINYDTLTERGQYEIFSVFKTTVGSKNEFKYYDYANITNEERYNEYISKVKALSMQKSDITPVFGERLLTLSTCAYNTQNERLVVVARKKNI
ncbi:MAG: class B sortase, partial [Clostridia bacterium]|nr:class B sortase [Clostridia bacterium]